MEGPGAADDEKEEGTIVNGPLGNGVVEKIVERGEHQEVNQGPKGNEVGGEGDQDI